MSILLTVLALAVASFCATGRQRERLRKFQQQGSRSEQRAPGAGQLTGVRPEWRWPARQPDSLKTDPALLLDLAAAGLAAGTAVPAVLQSLGKACGEDSLCLTGQQLVLGADWATAWQGTPARLQTLGEALEPAWRDGISPLPLLVEAAARIRAERAQEAQEAAARLGVSLVLPLGLCQLPAFVLIGMVPIVLSLASGFFSTDWQLPTLPR